jgi:hypothetical protein
MVHIGDSHIFGTIYIGGVIDTKGGWEWLVAFYWPKCTRKLRLCFRVDSLQPFRVQLFWGRCHCDELIQQLTQEDSSWFAEDDIFSFFFGGYMMVYVHAVFLYNIQCIYIYSMLYVWAYVQCILILYMIIYVHMFSSNLTVWHFDITLEIGISQMCFLPGGIRRVAHGIPGLVNIQKAIENGPVEIVDFPMKIAWWIFPSFFVNVYQRVYPMMFPLFCSLFFSLMFICFFSACSQVKILGRACPTPPNQS